MPRWRNGIRSSLKNLWGQPREGSTPSLGTNIAEHLFLRRREDGQRNR